MTGWRPASIESAVVWGIGAMSLAFLFNCLGDMGTQSRVKRLESTIERLENQLRELKGGAK